jgi:hypothetical protein
MPKRASDADSRIFFDELVSLSASRLRVTGAIRLEDRHGVIPQYSFETGPLNWLRAEKADFG